MPLGSLTPGNANTSMQRQGIKHPITPRAPSISSSVRNTKSVLQSVMNMAGSIRLPTDRLRPGHLTISAGRHNGRLWQCKTPLRVLWNYSQVASLRLGQEVPVFSTLNSVEISSRLVGCTDLGAGEGAHFAMVAIHCLPQGISSDEDRELRALQAPGVCCLPHEELDKDILAEEQKQQAIIILLNQTSKSRPRLIELHRPPPLLHCPKPRLAEADGIKLCPFSRNRRTVCQYRKTRLSI